MDNFRLLFCKKAPWCNIQLKSPAKPLMFPVLRIVYYFYSETLPKQWPKSSACWEISIRSSMNELVFYSFFLSQELSFRNTSTNLMVIGTQNILCWKMLPSFLGKWNIPFSNNVVTCGWVIYRHGQMYQAFSFFSDFRFHLGITSISVYFQYDG